ncbi:RCC1/BLIP-II [Patellaria atrata CBS 101060]|uniref:RCC1/BLIP-II n=1 Tax=Patellaria atrata CBS 101060 TaxID=1346257 RepID=A0A9P4S9Z8_9PEZI|nr:RCC1/BLIP-II [Patellaria atrata CBS 101060]
MTPFKLYALGSNGSGQLGIGDCQDTEIPTPVIFSEYTKQTNFRRISAGGNHTLILGNLLRTTGTGYVPGTITWPSIALVTAQTVDHSAGAVQLCSATWQASFLLVNGTLLSGGIGEKGELGHGVGDVQSFAFHPIREIPPPGSSIIDLSSSITHTVAVLDNGDVYGWGSGRKGQIGEPAVDCWQPRKIEGIPFKAVRAVCGQYFTFIVGASGTGACLVIGSDKHSIKTGAPEKLPLWKDVAASWGNIYVLLESGELLGWGRNDHGQLPPEKLPELTMIAAGSEHVVAKTSTGKVITWGWGEHGNCGIPVDESHDVKGRWNELPISENVVGLGAGCATTFIAVEDDSDTYARVINALVTTH